MDTQGPGGPAPTAGPVEAPRRTLPPSAATAAMAVGWVIVLVAGLLVAARSVGWPGSQVGFVLVSVASLGTALWCRRRSRARGQGARTGPTSLTVPDGQTLAGRRERARRLEGALHTGQVADADRPAATLEAGERLATAASTALTATMVIVVGLSYLASLSASASADGPLLTVIWVVLLAAGLTMMGTSTVTVLRWRRLVHCAGLG